ncbi:MAG: long-chain-fatty-acid--CoA ligase [Gammaproteobacteria bacterium]
MSYLTQAIHRAMRQYPQRTATVCCGRRRSYAEVGERVARAAAALRQLGMEAGERVGILSMNSDRYLEAYFAVWWGGGAINPLNIRWSAREIAYALDDSDTRVLIVDDSFAPMVAELSERARRLRTVIFAGDAQAPAGMFDYEQLIAEHAPAADAMRSGADLAGVFYTGGTTGRPKGVMLSHANLYAGTFVGLAEGVARADDIGLHAAPMFHLADGMFLLVLSMLGCTQVILPAFQPDAVLDVLQAESVSCALLVPTMIQLLVDHPRLAGLRLHALRQIVYGASPISEALLQRAMQRLPSTGFLQCYGQTEMSPIVSVLPPEYHADPRHRGKLRSAGRPAAGVEVKIVDAEGRELPRGSVGEIAARGPGVMQGYWNSPEQTRAAIRDGWMHTGDGAYLDEDGFLFVVDRVKDMIVSGGENVYSAEVENAIAQHPAVAACAVIGIPDPQWGEAVHAVVVCKPGAAVDAEAIRRHCRELIAGYKCPRSVEFRDALPLSGAGKVLKTELREPYWRGQARRVG